MRSSAGKSISAWYRSQWRTTPTARAGVKEQILMHKGREFHALGVVLGSRLKTSPVLTPDDVASTAPSDSSLYVPSANPGSLAPHMWLDEGSAAGSSLYDHFALDSMTLLITRPGAAAAAEGIVKAAAVAGIPLRVIAPSSTALQTLYEADMALIRPDQVIAWRGNSPDDASKALLRAVGR